MPKGQRLYQLAYILLPLPNLGGTLLLISILLGVVLLLSRKRSREYRRVLHDETERIDVLVSSLVPTITPF